MVLGRKKPGPAPTSEVGDQLLEDGEKLLAEQRYREAYECFQGAVSHLPTKQLAWYNLGFSASELWQAEAAEAAEAGDEFLPRALEAFRTVLRLDTSKRAELRYLSALALGRLLTRQAEAEGEESAVLEALQHFGEAWRLVQEWGAPDLGADWGDWGKAQALEMKRRIESIEGLGPGLGQVNWQEQLQVLSKLCEEAAEKFTRAQTAIDDEGDEDDDGMEERDVDWMVLHVEHLLEFVNFAKVALNNCQSLETKTEWLRRALLAWRSALTEILAICYLAPGYDALKGDTFAAACRLLLASPETVSALRSISLGQLFGPETWPLEEGLLLPELPRHGANGELVDPLPPAVTEEQLAALAEAAYVAAGAPLPLGELQLELGRLALARQLDPKPHLQKASEAFQAAGKKRDDKAIAWYNLACVAGLAGRPDAAARALKMCLEALPKPSEKVSWMQEALQDLDLQPVMNTPDMQAVQALLPQKKATPKKPLGGYAPKRRVIQRGGCRVWVPDAFHPK